MSSHCFTSTISAFTYPGMLIVQSREAANCMEAAYLVCKLAAGLWLHLGAHPLRVLPWHSWQISSLHEPQSPGEDISGTAGKLRCHLRHVFCRCCWSFQTLTGLQVRFFTLLPTHFFMIVSQTSVMFIGIHSVGKVRNARGFERTKTY